MKNIFPLTTRQKPFTTRYKPLTSRRIFNLSYSLFLLSYFLFSCSPAKQINKQAERLLFSDEAIKQGHIGISVFDPATGKYLYNHNADKYFIPASNTKLFSWYAGMKYLGDSLVGIRYEQITDTEYNIYPTGDPTFLHPDYKSQPVFYFLKNSHKAFYIRENEKSNFRFLGNGWAWNDYNEYYMVERNSFPIYGNVINLKADSFIVKTRDNNYNYAIINWDISPQYFRSFIDSTFTPLKWLAKNPRFDVAILNEQIKKIDIARDFNSNKLQIKEAVSYLSPQEIPMSTDRIKTSIAILKNDHTINIEEGWLSDHALSSEIRPADKTKKLYSQPSDSLFKPMMHRSDNFFAEQTLLMASNEYLGYMSDRDMIDTILKTTLKDIPQQPRWVDGSGLSRYNLFTPQDFVWLLNKTKNEFSWERIKNILPTGGEGTLSSYYKDEQGFIYAKTGILSNNCALSGYLITKKNKVLIFSVLVNNYPTGATPVRRAVEKFIKELREKY